MLRGWYAHNGVSLGNPRLGFVCTAQTTDGQHGLAGYFLEHRHELSPDERLVFRPGELPPPFVAASAPQLQTTVWTQERLAKARRNYTLEYIRSGLPRLVEQLGPAEAGSLGRIAGRLIGAQYYHETAALVGVSGDRAEDFAAWMKAIAAGEDDPVDVTRDAGCITIRRRTWRLMRGLGPLSPAIFEAWNGLFEGAIAVHNRFLVLDVIERLDQGDAQFLWRIREPRVIA
jgi:hypothetical protein